MNNSAIELLSHEVSELNDEIWGLKNFLTQLEGKQTRADLESKAKARERLEFLKRTRNQIQAALFPQKTGKADLQFLASPHSAEGSSQFARPSSGRKIKQSAQLTGRISLPRGPVYFLSKQRKMHKVFGN